MTIRLVGRPLLARTLVAAVSIRGDQPEVTYRNNHDRVRLVVEAARASIVVHKTVREREVKAGSTVHYTITLRSPGTAAALDLHVCDRLPHDQVFAQVDGAAFVNGQACWTIRRLAPGTTKEFTVVAIVARSPTTHSSTNLVRVLGANVPARSATATVHVIGVPGQPGGGGG